MATVYVIDDSDTTRSFFENALQKNHEVHTAGSMKELEQTMDLDKANVLFLDCWLGEEEGLDVLEELRKESDLPVVMISGYADHSLVSRAEQLGVRGFIEKPLTPEKIRDHVKNIEAGQEEGELSDVSEVSFYGSPRILIVDDDQAILQLLSRPLDHYEIDYMTAVSPDEAMEKAERFDPNIIILDARLDHETSSAELHQYLHEQDENRFFIGITGYPESDEIESLRKEGLVEVFYKPFSLQKLVRTLAHLSYVIDSREKGVDEDVTPEPEEKEDLRKTIKKYTLIGVIFVLIGLMLGFGLMGLQTMLRQYSSEKTTFEKMFESIEGYLHRDEEREQRSLP